MEKEKSCCSSSCGRCSKTKCIAILALCVSIFILGFMAGKCCSKSYSGKAYKCKTQKSCTFSGDAISGETCDSSKSKCCKKSKKTECKGTPETDTVIKE